MKRHREFVEEFSGEIKKPKQLGRVSFFDELCNYYDGIYVGSRFIGLTLPKEGRMLLKTIKQVTGIKNIDNVTFIETNWSDKPHVNENKVLRVGLNIDLYNKHFALTQKYDTYNKSVEEIKETLVKKLKEEELFEDIVKGNVYNNITAYYLNGNIVEPAEWGLEVMKCIQDYFMFGDRKYVEMGNKEDCMRLLNGPLMRRGLVKPCENFDHPPIPVNVKKSPGTFVFKSSRTVYIPTMSFYDINYYDSCTIPFNIPTENVKFHRIDNYETLDKDTTLLMTVGAHGIKDVHSIYSYNNKLPQDTKNVVLIFKNNGELKNYELLNHVLFPGLSRASALFRYVIPEKMIGKIVCYVAIKKFNN